MRKRNFIKLVLALTLMTNTAMGVAQSRITYSYDSAGNRRSRTIALSRSAEYDESEYYVTDALQEVEVKIYPNPTKGMLKIQLVNYSGDVLANFMVYSLQGTLIKSLTVSESTVIIDLSGYQNGLYILKIKIGETDTSWKIIKE